MSKKMPAFMFYTGDWMKDPALRGCSLAARGLWIDMLCLMHENPRRGYLQHTSGNPVLLEQLCRMTGCSTDEGSRLLQELEDFGVFSRADNGVVYSRRMVADERKRNQCSDAGKRGGNPILLKSNKPTDKPSNKPEPKRNGEGGDKPELTPSYSSSLSPSGPTGEESLAEFNRVFSAYPRQGGRSTAWTRWVTLGLTRHADRIRAQLDRDRPNWGENGRYAPKFVEWIDRDWTALPASGPRMPQDASEVAAWWRRTPEDEKGRIANRSGLPVQSLTTLINHLTPPEVLIGIWREASGAA